MVVVQQPAEPLPSCHSPVKMQLLREKQLVSQALMIALAVVVCQKLREHTSQASFAKQNHAMQA
jgi:hypothetical protein